MSTKNLPVNSNTYETVVAINESYMLYALHV